MANSPGHECPAAEWRTSEKQVDHLLRTHADCEDGVECPQIVTAQAADLMVETMECPDCRRAIFDLIELMVTSERVDFSRMLVLSLVSSLAFADKKINEGIEAYEAIPDFLKETVEPGKRN